MNFSLYTFDAFILLKGNEYVMSYFANAFTVVLDRLKLNEENVFDTFIAIDSPEYMPYNNVPL